MYADTRGSPQAPPVVLLHGGIGTGRYHWSKLLKALGDDYYVHLPDLPGHGGTPWPENGDDDSRAVLVGAVEEYLLSLGAPVHVAAFSLGGHVSMALAARRPQLFASLTLIGVSLRDHAGLKEWRAVFEPDRFAQTYPAWARQLSKLHDPQGGETAWRDVARRDSGGIALDVDPSALAEVACPVLLVRGDRDSVVAPAQYAELRELWPNSEELVVPRGGHDVQLSRWRIVQPALLDFLKRAEAAR